MPPPPKPRDRTGYVSTQTAQVRSTCLTVAVTLGALMDDLCVVGGLVPGLLIDQQRVPDPAAEHVGTSDLDVGLALGVLDGRHYSQISHRLRQEGFSPDTGTSAATPPRNAGGWGSARSLWTSCSRPSLAPGGEAACTTWRATSVR